MALDAYVFIGYPINEHEKVIMKKLLIAALLTQPLIVGVNAADSALNDISGDEELAIRLSIEEFEQQVRFDEMRSASELSSPRSDSIESDEEIARLLAGIESMSHNSDDYVNSIGELLIDPTDFEKFHAVSAELRKIYTHGANVHTGDNYIPGQIASILGIASKILAVCSPDINMISLKPLSDQKGDLKAIFNIYADTLDGYKYEGSAKSLSDILNIIDSQFDRSAKEINSYASGQGAQVWAFTLALAMNMLNDMDVRDEVKQTIVQHLVDQSIEGMLTQGGCIQGFVNRGFIALMNMVAYYLPR